MADKDSWWKDKNEGKGSETNPFLPKKVQNDSDSFKPVLINEGVSLIDNLNKDKSSDKEEILLEVEKK